MNTEVLQKVLLSVHLLGAFIMLVGVGLMAVTMIGLRRAATGEGVRQALFAGWFVEKVMPPGVILVLFAGIWMAFLKDPDYTWHSAWIITAFVLVLIFTVNGIAHIGAKMKRLGMQTAGKNGPLPPNLKAMCNDAALHASAWLGVGIIFSFIILMVGKPNWLGTLGTVTMGAAAGLAANLLNARTAALNGSARKK